MSTATSSNQSTHAENDDKNYEPKTWLGKGIKIAEKAADGFVASNGPVGYLGYNMLKSLGKNIFKHATGSNITKFADQKVSKFITKNAGTAVGSVINRGYLGQRVKNYVSNHGDAINDVSNKMLGKNSEGAVNASNFVKAAKGESVPLRSINETAEETRRMQERERRKEEARLNDYNLANMVPLNQYYQQPYMPYARGVGTSNFMSQTKFGSSSVPYRSHIARLRRSRKNKRFLLPKTK